MYFRLLIVSTVVLVSVAGRPGINAIQDEANHWHSVALNQISGAGQHWPSDGTRRATQMTTSTLLEMETASVTNRAGGLSIRTMS